MTKPLQTKKRRSPDAVPVLRVLRPWILPTVVSTLLSLHPSLLFGQGDMPQSPLFIRDNYGQPVLNASEMTFSGEMLRRLHPTDLLRALELADPSLSGFDSDNGDDLNSPPPAAGRAGCTLFCLESEWCG